MRRQSRPRACPSCEGNQAVTCPECRGSGGMWESGGGITACERCGGDGMIPCAECDGAGVPPTGEDE